jgi:hypothetical protein
MEILKKNKILIFFLIVLINQSLGSVQRWDLNEQIGMADNLYFESTVYPTNNFSIFSIYTPGVSFIAYSIRTLGIFQYLTEVLLILSSIILFLTILLFYKIIELHQKPNAYFFEIQIIYTLLLCLGFVHYSTEFKPDTITFLICFFGLYVYQKNKNIRSMIFGSILIGTSILFKQQSVFFVIGLIFYSLFNLKRKDDLKIHFTLDIYFRYNNHFFISFESVFKYNYEIISDDGFQTIFNISKFLWDQFKGIILTICVMIPLIKRKTINFDKFSNFMNNPYSFIIISIFLGSFLSFLKNGGNTGNIQVGLFYLSLLFWIYFNDTIFRRLSILTCFLIIVFSIDLGKIINYNRYLDNMKIITSSIIKNSFNNILTDSDTYSLTRILRSKNSKITNIETLKHLGLIDTINENFISDFDVIILKDEIYTNLKIDLTSKPFFKLNNTEGLSIYVKDNFTQ